jgi:hypothetical protein
VISLGAGKPLLLARGRSRWRVRLPQNPGQLVVELLDTDGLSARVRIS